MRSRLVVIALFTFALFSVLLVQFYKIQLVDGQTWSKRALRQHSLLVTEPFKRGTFYSNTEVKKGHLEKAQPLAFDVTKFHLFIDPQAIPNEKKLAMIEALTGLLVLDDSEKLFLQRAFEKKCRSRKIASWLDRKTKTAVFQWWAPFARQEKIAKNALYSVTDYKRSYPFGKLLGQVLHTIRDAKDQKTNQGIPTGGLEAQFNEYLRGKQGSRALMRSPLNSLEANQIFELPEDGADVYLTINHTIQAIVEEELEKGVKGAKAKGGWAVMMDPHDGSILAMAQYPFFHPEQYRTYFNDPNKIESTKIKPIVDAFELGSIMKPLTLAVCLKANQELAARGEPPLFDPEEKIGTTRTRFPGRENKPLKDRHRYLNMYMALQKSSNVYLAILAERMVNQLGNDWYREALHSTFGFGEKCSIELPGETGGFLPSIGKYYPNKAPQWSLSTPYSLCMGYNLLATSLQMVRAYAVFANGGYLVEPTLVKKIVKKDSDGHEKKLVDNVSAMRVKRFRRVLDDHSCETVMKALKYVTKPGGTGRLAQVYGYTVVGKSGTAEKVTAGGQYSKKLHVSSFVGFTPAQIDDPKASRFVLLVSIDEPEASTTAEGIKRHLGGRCAAPIFAKMAKRTLAYLGVSPDDPHGYPQGDPRFDSAKANWIQETRALRRLYEKWNFAR